MGAKKGKGKGEQPALSKKDQVAKMYILNDIPPEEFAKAMGKYNYAKAPR